jgi:D-alanyl-D-alanine dipeptidase
MAQFLLEFGREPDSVPTRWRPLIGEYGPDTVTRWFTIERDRRLWIRDERGNFAPLTERSPYVFDAPVMPVPVSGEVRFHVDSTGQVASVQVGDRVMPRRRVEPPPGATQLRITPVRPIEEIRREALAATPPAETGSFQPVDLVELTTLDSTIRLDIRYASDDNFLGLRVYDTARAFLQRPAAEALGRASRNARRVGYGLLIHDAYRPWYVTKIFWDATPADAKWMVADPAQGSRHNRGIAVDVTLYDLETKRPVEMPSTYDESTGRSHSMYPGGTSLQRHYRALLRRVLEHEGFAVHPLEWWHFDYIDFKRYPIGNVPFDGIGK